MDGDRDPGVARCALPPGYYISRLQRDDQRNKLSPPLWSGYCPDACGRSVTRLCCPAYSLSRVSRCLVVDSVTLGGPDRSRRDGNAVVALDSVNGAESNS